MKKNHTLLKMLTLTSYILLITTCTTVSPKQEATIHFENAEHNFGAIPYRKEAEYSFRFNNPGEVPLVINDVKTTCGCTVPDWPQKPVKPGSEDEIKIKYDADSPGIFNKKVLVHYNGPDSPAELIIKGQVAYPD